MQDLNHQKIIELGQEVLNLESLAIKECSDRLDHSFAQACTLILEQKKRVALVGIGKSGQIGHKIASTLSSTGTPAYFLHPAEAFHGDLGQVEPGDVAILLSSSGKTEEVLRLIPFFKENKNPIISMTGNGDSVLAKNSEVWLDTSVSKEACPLDLAPTTSSTLTLAIGDALAMSLMRLKNFSREDFAKFHPGGNLGKRLLTRVRDIMVSENLPIVEESDSFEKVVDVISSGRMGICVLLDSNNQVKGVITDGDLRRAMQAKGKDIFQGQASELASLNPRSVLPDAKVIEAERLASDNKITVLLVVESGKLLGLFHLYEVGQEH